MIYPEVQELTESELKHLCEEYRRNNFIDPKVSEKLGVKRGLRNPDGTGVLAGLTNICDVIGYEKNEQGEIVPCDGKLLYRGIDLECIIEEAVNKDRFMFEEVIWLLLFGSLPSAENMERFRRLMEEHHDLPTGFAESMIMGAPSPNIMNKMARSVLAMYSYDEKADDTSLENILKQSVNLISELSTITVYAYQAKKHVYDHESMYIHFPQRGLSTSEHILATLRPDQAFTHEEAKLLDLCLVVHADHGGGNNSTFTNRVISSTGTDTYSAIAGAITSLKGPLHGGANLKVMAQLDDMLEKVDPYDEKGVKEYLRGLLNGKYGDGSGLIYGIGHAVYTKSDPRAQILKKYSQPLAVRKGFVKQYDALCMVEKLAPEVFREEKHITKPMCANMDLFSGLVYRMLGIPEELFTPIFAIARVSGWCAHRMEEVEFCRKIMRPAYKYIGGEADYIPLDQRD